MGSTDPFNAGPRRGFEPAVGGGFEYFVIHPWLSFALHLEITVAWRYDGTTLGEPIASIRLKALEIPIGR